MVHNHPHQNVYCSRLASDEFSTLFEMDYWGLSNDQALSYIESREEAGNFSIWPGSAMRLDRTVLLLWSTQRSRFSIVENDKDSGCLQAMTAVTLMARVSFPGRIRVIRGNP
ncbi:MAG: hypothetical protein ACJA09_002014 [Alcanivorax sp.]|jgi:hypothetical protein